MKSRFLFQVYRQNKKPKKNSKVRFIFWPRLELLPVRWNFLHIVEVNVPFSVDPARSPSLSGDGVVYVKDINQPSLSTPFYSVLVPTSVCVTLSSVSHSIISPYNSLLSQFIRSYLCLLCPFNFISLYESLLQPWYNPLWLTGLKAPN